jgi:phosphoribosyl-dephospho-CoA transferase
VSAPRPHDLLRITLPRSAIPVDAPAWVHQSLTRAPWTVVRRAAAPPGHIAIGVRGATRAHRYALTLPSPAVVKRVAPEELAQVDLCIHRSLPAIDALRALRPQLMATGLRWGPTGAVGFELASGAPHVHPASDLDLAVYVDLANAAVKQRLRALDRVLKSVKVRIDCQIEFPWGAVALAEITSEAPQLLVRCATGPRLIDAAALTP